MSITVPQAVARLLEIVAQLNAAYPTKKFTLDGRLVGDIGEILAAAAYDVELLEGLQKWHDAKSPDGKLVQIKATMKDSLTFPADHVPDFYLGIKIDSSGTFSEIFNGPGRIARQAIERRKLPKTNLHSVSVFALKALNKRVSESDRIPRREPAFLQSRG